MRLALLTVAVAALVSGSIAGGATTRPALGVADSAPLTLRGIGFKQRERVRVAVVVVYQSERRTRVVRASARGVFTVVFAGIEMRDPCSFDASAIGGQGSRAAIKAQRMCPPPL